MLLIRQTLMAPCSQSPRQRAITLVPTRANLEPHDLEAPEALHPQANANLRATDFAPG